MAGSGISQFGEPDSPNKNNLSPIESDAAFHAEPLNSANAFKIEDHATKTDPSFIQNQISIQRSPSNAISRALSTKSNGSPTLSRSAIAGAGVLSDNSEQECRGRGGDSDVNMTEDTNNCTLKKSSSTSTDRSAKSTRSMKSVRSVNAVGSYPLGSLRVHSPSPTRSPDIDNHEFLKSGDVIVIRDIPPGSIIGYDTRSFTIKAGDNFEGIKDIPPGAHFVWGGSGAASLRTGFWIMSAKRASDELGEVHVKRWNSYDETLTEEVSAAEIRIQKASVPEIFDKLQTYTISNPTKSQSVPGMTQFDAKGSNIWNHLTSSMKGALLTKITGKPWNHWQVSSTHDYQPAVGRSVADDPMGFRHDEVLKFVFPRDDRTFSTDSIGRDRTEQAMDSSSHIMAVITGSCTYEDSDEIIGELQFCYITGMILGNVACMEQWAHIVKALFRAFRLALDLPVFFRKAIEAVHAQLIYDEEGLEGSILDHDPNLAEDLKMLLTVFKSRLNEMLLAQGVNLTNEQNAVGKAFEEFESWLWKWGWDLRGNYVRSGKIQLEDGEFVDAELTDFEAEDERGEYAPVMVDLDEEGHERGLIRL
ncbi:hypothetical protein M430DRAFT_61145 [Amorphotheca resinae ATCC 22711]|uniref:Uncharacterized protein n=1 Tax=Amorphotheca resinae ATCC 22711 TaxID=857342 RepID=A0A2T3ATD9_AMORE|nr:hypothetical protein M430DRAFT_61145 [Amorphotheca resinae ATCC 22711]PSS10746.1 hypothetical protein M430DRAFT_61145 [Amorphotheca resinae ATCC 22711]